MFLGGGRGVEREREKRERRKKRKGKKLTFFFSSLSKKKNSSSSLPPPPPLSGGFYGTSTAAIADLLEPYGYSFLLSDNDDSKTEHNVYLVRDDLVAAGATPDAPRDVCSIYYGGMRRYHCIHACHQDENFEGIGGGERFDTTKAWTRELSRASEGGDEPDVDAVRGTLSRVWANAAAKHAEVIGGRPEFSMGVLKYVDVKSCGAGFA